MLPHSSHRVVDGSYVGQVDFQSNAPYVLVVDDDPAVRQLIERCLISEGYHVRHAADAIAALESMAERAASLVLCDIRMPGHDGLWLAERLQAEWPSTPIVMVTAIDDLRTVQQSRELGAIDYLTKPIDRAQLHRVIQRAMPRPTVTLDPSNDGSLNAQPQPEPATEAEYTLETPVRCPACGERISALKAVRLIRTRVNFTSTLPRRGRVLACPHCLAMVPAELTNF
jgi:CheY-like chemotaxis protein